MGGLGVKKIPQLREHAVGGGRMSLKTGYHSKA